MIKVDFEEPNTQEWNEWKSKCHTKTETLIQNANNGVELNIDNDLYKEQKSKLYELFNGKCAYCEKKIEESYESPIDHFRPKNKVTDVNDNQIVINGAYHPGYYWLAYDWHNLILSCQLCNQPHNEEGHKLGKRCRFPLEDDNYALSPGEEINERPLLIDPTKENPQNHLKYNSKTKLIEPINESVRGKTCIEVFGLILREDLKEGREKAYEEVKSLLSQFAFATKDNRVDILRKLEAIKAGEKPHSIAAITALHEFKSDMEPLWNQ